jgi:SAM-dependent methyltransferase
MRPMGRPGNLFDNAKTLAGGKGYYEYELEVGRSIVLPWLAKRMELEGLDVGDFGCHAGGVLQALREGGGIASGQGFDLDERAIRESPFPEDERFRLQVGNVLDLDDRTYDLILLRDVLEHVPERERIVDVCARTLRPGGRLFVSFPPYYSPFGGHQHVAANWTKLAPYLHLLPERLFMRLVKLEDNVYLASDDLLGDMTSVRATRLTIGKAEAAFARAGLRVESRQLFVLRPEFGVRYGIRALDAHGLGSVRGLRDLVVMGAFYLLRAPVPG